MTDENSRQKVLQDTMALTNESTVTRRASLLGAGFLAGAVALGGGGAARAQTRSVKTPNPDVDLFAFVQEQIDSTAIGQLVLRERRARDMQDWAGLAASYTANSTVDMSWFKGTGAQFAEASSKMAAGGLLTFHEPGPTFTQIEGNRALGDTAMTLHVVREIGGVDVDITGYIRALTRHERQSDGGWLMAGFRSYYVHDLILPVNPSRVPEIDPAALKDFRPSYRYLSWVLSISGHPISNELPGIDRPETVKALIATEQSWLKEQ
tara:strand:+ start:2649 stop:3443 length:795 start_codon:yes stop_codon:yes gene_type:complete